MPYLPPLRDPVRQIGRRRFDFDREIVVMGIVNRTPDSFFDQGRTYALDRAVDAALAAAQAGAGWVDIGGVFVAALALRATERGHAYHRKLQDFAEELERVLPVVTGVAMQSDVVISVDTFRPEVAAECLAAGAAVVNDTTGLRDPELAAVIAAAGATVVITHSLAAPRQHFRRPEYGDVVAEVRAFLAERAAFAVSQGIPESRIVLDPGHDLNKNTRHSLELTRRLGEIADLGLPLLAAVSNKDFVGEATGLARPDRTPPSLAAATACALAGARVLRMHDVPAAIAVARMTETILGLREPAELRHNLD